ncbi:DUF2946 domain-containing protein [Roseixanthobacter pseudopolyaromaticivorans]|uniref:DUF2946 domain-containing protein n=1 Tax=Xanthobacteraceae TaxID=335928 RepID=UPI00372A4174
MIERLRHGWGGARAVAWTVVYALVLQIVLTSAFLASRSLGPSSDAFQICLNDPSAPKPKGDSDERSKAFVHCPLCLSRVDLAILPSAPATPVIARLAVVFQFHLYEGADPTLSGVRVAHRPRGPPILG